MSRVIGFDIGGTKCAVLLAEVTGDKVVFIERQEIITTSDWQEVLDKLIALSLDMKIRHQGDYEGCAIGVSCGGPLDCEKGLILSPPNLPGWDRVPVTRYLEQRFHMPARLRNDADACALAEWKFGAGRGCRHMIFITFGTGLGAGLILNGKLYEGACGMAGEAGHIRLEDDGPEGYGKRGSLEGFCSGGGIAQIAKKAARELEEAGKKASYVNTVIDDVTARDVAIAAENGHEDALTVFSISGRYFGKGLSILIDILNPEKIVIGSIFTRAGKFMIKEMEKEIAREALPNSAAACDIISAQLGEQIGDYGAVVAALACS